MAKVEKYIELTSYLEKCGKDELTLTFSEIESILGYKLMDSAYKYPALWSNSESHTIAFGWLNAGYNTRNVDIPNQTVEFVKTGYGASVKESKVAMQTARKQAVRKNCLPIETALENIKVYFNATVEDKHGRYMSWRHCYNNFVSLRTHRDDMTVDYLCLHLAFYLASWGMYRGSSFLLQKDYKVHEPVVRIIMEEKYDSLCGITAEELLEDKNFDLLDDISDRIRRAYAEERPSFEGKVNNATDTLVSKILLGALGCVPAYDRYYIQAVKHYEISSGNYDRNSVRDIAKYYIDNKTDFEAIRHQMSECGTEYPAMKLMDMCMWQAGFSEEDEEKE